MKTAKYFLAILIFFGFLSISFSQEIEGKVRSISPDSKKIIVFSEYNEYISVLDALTFSQLYNKKRNKSYNSCLFVSDSSFIFNDDSLKYKIINYYTGVIETVGKLTGIRSSYLHYDHNLNTLYIISSGIDSENSIVYLYNFNSGTLEKFKINKNLNWTFDIDVFSKYILYANIDGFLSKFDLQKEQINFIKDSEGNKVDMNESTVNLFNNNKSILISFYTSKKIAIFEIQTKKLKYLNEYNGYGFPRLAPNEKDLYADDSNNPPFYSKKFKFNAL